MRMVRKEAEATRRDGTRDRADLGVSLEDLEPARAVRLFGHGPEEVGPSKTVYLAVLVVLIFGGEETRGFLRVLARCSRAPTESVRVRRRRLVVVRGGGRGGLGGRDERGVVRERGERGGQLRLRGLLGVVGAAEEGEVLGWRSGEARHLVLRDGAAGERRGEGRAGEGERREGCAGVEHGGEQVSSQPPTEE